MLLELAAYSEDERAAFLSELTEVSWVYRALENDRIGTLGVSEKIGQSTLSLHVSYRLYLDLPPPASLRSFFDGENE